MYKTFIDAREWSYEMLHIFANALLIAARFDPPQAPQRPRPQDEAAPTRRWLRIAGLRF